MGVLAMQCKLVRCRVHERYQQKFLANASIIETMKPAWHVLRIITTICIAFLLKGEMTWCKTLGWKLELSNCAQRIARRAAEIHSEMYNGQQQRFLACNAKECNDVRGILDSLSVMSGTPCTQNVMAYLGIPVLRLPWPAQN
eukprot:6490416-Amphidinium_carterae.2